MSAVEGVIARLMWTDPRTPKVVTRWMRKLAPLPAFFAPPVAQIYIADDEFETYLCVNNFLGMLTPEAQIPAQARVQIRDETGASVVDHAVTLAPRGSKAIAVSELLRNAGASPRLGLATCRLRAIDPTHDQVAVYKTMGRITSHFFTYYLDRKTQAMAMIHPQSTIREASNRGRGGLRRSGQTIVTKGLESLRFYQPNHSARDAHVEIALHDFDTGEEVRQAALDVPAYSVRSVDFDAQDGTLPARLYFTVGPLPNPHAKPLIMRRYPAGRFSMSHS